MLVKQKKEALQKSYQNQSRFSLQKYQIPRFTADLLTQMVKSGILQILLHGKAVLLCQDLVIQLIPGVS